MDDLSGLRTARLLMRRWRNSDREPFAALNADPEVMRYLPSPLDRAGSDRVVGRIEQRFEEQGFGLWALEVLSTGEFVGFTGLNPMPEGVPGTGDFEVGWRLARRAWHRGMRPRQVARRSTWGGGWGSRSSGRSPRWSTSPPSP